MTDLSPCFQSRLVVDEAILPCKSSRHANFRLEKPQKRPKWKEVVCMQITLQVLVTYLKLAQQPLYVSVEDLWTKIPAMCILLDIRIYIYTYMFSRVWSSTNAWVSWHYAQQSRKNIQKSRDRIHTRHGHILNLQLNVFCLCPKACSHHFDGVY